MSGSNDSVNTSVDLAADIWSKKQFMWRIRRGTKELDVMFNRFMDKSFDALTPQETAHFQRLLTIIEDPDLQRWLTNDVRDIDTEIHSLQKDNGLSNIVRKIRQANHC